jgi:hypothetical protein
MHLERAVWARLRLMCLCVAWGASFCTEAGTRELTRISLQSSTHLSTKLWYFFTHDSVEFWLDALRVLFYFQGNTELRIE